jgi:transcriptional repressor NrdR
MNCPYCGYIDSKVIDSRDINDGIRRRRQCLSCEKRFTTYERIQTASLLIVKKDLRREDYNRDKLLTGVLKACQKRPLPEGAAEKLVDEVEAGIFNLGKNEVPSTLIGDMVMQKLKDLDTIAYIRFASVYREFADIQTLKEAVDRLLVADKSPLPGQLPLIPEDHTSAPQHVGAKSRNVK